MIYYDTEYPSFMTGELLDDYLRRGWYRIQQTIITTDLIFSEGMFMPVFWLRMNLHSFRMSASARRIAAINRRHTVSVGEFGISQEVEDLYAAYRASIDFHIPETAREYLLGDRETNVYDTSLIEIRDEGRLIAAGYYDHGVESATGILHIYQPSYKRLSLGKYLMLIEINQSMDSGMRYYYPGYISTETGKYDYKLFPDRHAAEIYVRSNEKWFPFNIIYDDLITWSRTATRLINEQKNS